MQKLKNNLVFYEVIFLTSKLFFFETYMNMIVANNLPDRTSFQGVTRRQMEFWKYLNRIPKYTNATYNGFTGYKSFQFPITEHFQRSMYPDITENLHKFETEILQELKDCKSERFGYFRALWKMAQNFGTGEPWDSKFLPKFPGRNKKGKKQYAIYKGEILSANDVSNLVYGHVCSFMGIPENLAKFIAKLDAKGFLEIISKRKIPKIKQLKFNDTHSDQLAIAKGIREFNINDYILE